jgi:uncharacterized RDD family membrane protein YckC
MLQDDRPTGGVTNENESQNAFAQGAFFPAQGAQIPAFVPAGNPASQGGAEVQVPWTGQGVPQTADGRRDPYPAQIEQPAETTRRTSAHWLYEEAGFIPGGFWVRLSAWMIDGMVSSILSVSGYLACRNLFGTAVTRPFFFSLSLGTCFGYLFILLYRILMTKLAGATLGKMALRLKVVDTGTGGNLSWWQAIFRESFGRLASDFSIVGDLLIIGKEHRTLTDRLSDSSVVYR